MAVIQLPIILHRDRHYEALLHLVVKVDQVGINVIGPSPTRSQRQRYGESTTERFNQAAILETHPDRSDMWNQPPLPTCPFQNGFQPSLPLKVDLTLNSHGNDSFAFPYSSLRPIFPL
jgi:hypothetical protein